MLISEKTVLLTCRNIFIVKYNVFDIFFVRFFSSMIQIFRGIVSNTEIGFLWPHLCDEAALLIYIKAKISVYSVTEVSEIHIHMHA